MLLLGIRKNIIELGDLHNVGGTSALMGFCPPQDDVSHWVQRSRLF